jgi:hypothetical protein
MSLSDYKVSTPMAFDKFYDEFYRNNLQESQYTITLKDGTVAEGVPTACPFINFQDPNYPFYFSSNGNKYKIPFNDLVSAEKVLLKKPSAIS